MTIHRTLSLAILLLVFCTQAKAQKYFTRNAHVSFFSVTPVENIEAHNQQVTSIIDLNNGEMAFSVLIKAFEFEKALMQEHFNEKYMESEKYPKAKFEGTMAGMEKLDLSKAGTHKVQVKGKLTVHGVTKEVQTEGTLEVKEGTIHGTAKFPVKVKDYGITIPSVVKDNIAEVVDVTVNAKYEPYQK